MSKVTALFELALGAAVAYREIRRPRKRFVLAWEIALLVVAMLLMMTALAFGLATVFWALMGLGIVAACGLTALVALVLGLLALAVWRPISRWK